MDDRAEQARRNRELMPETARIVDEWRAVFGAVRVMWAQENGIEIGERGPQGVPLSAVPKGNGK